MGIKKNEKPVMKMTGFLFSKGKKIKKRIFKKNIWQIHVFAQILPILLKLFFTYYKLYMKYDR